MWQEYDKICGDIMYFNTGGIHSCNPVLLAGKGRGKEQNHEGSRKEKREL